MRSGLLQYRFDCGSGEGLVRISDVSIADGQWHTVSLIRRGRQARLSLDKTFTAEGYAPGPNSVLNLYNTQVYFGAAVTSHPTLYGHDNIENC